MNRAAQASAPALTASRRGAQIAIEASTAARHGRQREQKGQVGHDLVPERKGRCRLLTLPGTTLAGFGELEAEHGPLLALAGQVDLAHQDLARRRRRTSAWC